MKRNLRGWQEKGIIFFFCWLLSTPIFAAIAETVETKILHKIVLWHEDPAHEAIISWSTDQESKNNSLHLKLDPQVFPEAQMISFKATKTEKVRGQKVFIHYVFLKNLLPSTSYYFTLLSEGIQSKEFSFTTAPKDGRNFSLLFGGDSRTDEKMRRVMNLRMQKLLESHPDILGLVHGGDYVENGGNWKQWLEWLQDHDLTTTSQGRVLPVIPARGNHERSVTLFNQVFAWPGEGKNYFTTKIGPLSCLTLNTELSAGGDQRLWLDQELKKRKADSQWIVANYHRAAWPAVKLPSSAKKHWVPLFEQNAVDLVFESDGHALKQTVPIFEGRMDRQKGVIYVGEGGLGVKQRKPMKRKSWYLQTPGYAEEAYHVQLLKVTPREMNYSVILQDGTIHSQLELSPRDRTNL